MPKLCEGEDEIGGGGGGGIGPEPEEGGVGIGEGDSKAFSGSGTPKPLKILIALARLVFLIDMVDSNDEGGGKVGAKGEGANNLDFGTFLRIKPCSRRKCPGGAAQYDMISTSDIGLSVRKGMSVDSKDDSATDLLLNPVNKNPNLQ
jgi:hypothetical protein